MQFGDGCDGLRYREESMEFYAHSTGRDDRSDWQSLQEHLSAVGELAARNAAAFGAEALGRASGQLHDLGKYTEKFQQRLRGEAPRMDHATWGAVVAQQRFKGVAGTLMAYAIAGHHAGLANGSSGITRSALRDRLSAEYRTGLPALLPDWEREIALAESVGLPNAFKSCRSRGMFQLAMLTRMIFSCLVDADFVDTDNFYRRIENESPRERGDSLSLETLRDRLDGYLRQLPSGRDIHQVRTEILTHVRAQAEAKPGLFSLTVPTGGGKTLTSLAFALDHAIAQGLRRVIFVIPFTSIIDQNAAVFRRVFGDLGETAVLEHHSAFIDQPGSEPQSYEKRRVAMENWDAPVIVTTAVQFFESLFADRPSRCRKLHNIAGSVVVLDEAQTLPLSLLRPCLAAIDELALNYRSSIVLCTATQPALRSDQGFPEGLDGVHELAPEPRRLYERLRRVTVRHVGRLDDEALTEHLRQREQVLCIVNNRRHAKHLFESIADQDGAFHLTTLMYAAHRRQVLDVIRQRLRDGLPCRLISTSLIEAGVDVSFPTVLRAEAGLDSIAQAAGRCNREGLWSPEHSEVLVFEVGNESWAPPPELKQFAEAFRAVERRHRDDLLAIEAVDAYFQEIYWRLGKGKLDKENLLGLLKDAGPDSLPLETLAANFRVIQTTMRPIIVPFEPGSSRRIDTVAEALDRLAFAPSAARKLQPYLVQVPQRAYDALRQVHAIQFVAQERYGEQFVQLVNADLYDARHGLHWDNPQFVDAERLVI
jgi:CRISPR-associated endonuclease/helicase Cas3